MSFVVWLLTTFFKDDPLIFDKHCGIFWEGKEQPGPTTGTGTARRHGRIADIYALQLISNYRWVGNPAMGASSDYRQYNTYELNLVMPDGARVSIVRRDDYDGLKKDAEVLATFLGRPLWERR